MFNRIKSIILLKPIIDILNENGVSQSEDYSMCNGRYINGAIGYKFKSKGIDLRLDGIYEVTITKTFTGFNIEAILGNGRAVYILLIPENCKDIVAKINIPDLNINSEGIIDTRTASNFINTFKKMYDSRLKINKLNFEKEIPLERLGYYLWRGKFDDILVIDKKQRTTLTINNPVTIREDKYRIGNTVKSKLVIKKTQNKNTKTTEILFDDIINLRQEKNQFVIEADKVNVFES